MGTYSFLAGICLTGPSCQSERRQFEWMEIQGSDRNVRWYHVTSGVLPMVPAKLSFVAQARPRAVAALAGTARSDVRIANLANIVVRLVFKKDKRQEYINECRKTDVSVWDGDWGKSRATGTTLDGERKGLR